MLWASGSSSDTLVFSRSSIRRSSYLGRDGSMRPVARVRQSTRSSTMVGARKDATSRLRSTLCGLHNLLRAWPSRPRLASLPSADNNMCHRPAGALWVAVGPARHVARRTWILRPRSGQSLPADDTDAGRQRDDPAVGCQGATAVNPCCHVGRIRSRSSSVRHRTAPGSSRGQTVGCARGDGAGAFLSLVTLGASSITC